MFVAFLKVIFVLSANLSVDEVLFNGISEQKLFYYQPVEVRVGLRVRVAGRVKI